ncbi:MAG: hypothetical protein WC299_09680 [Kiritimatiellia bacterium]
MPDKQVILSEPAWKWHYNLNRPAAGKNYRAIRLIIQTAIAFTAASVLAFIFHRILLAEIAAGIGLINLFCGLFLPRAHAKIEKYAALFAFLVGQCITWMLLVPFYYLCFLPARLILALAGRDPMKRTWDTSAPTYWDKKQDIQDKERITKQY